MPCRFRFGFTFCSFFHIHIYCCLFHIFIASRTESMGILVNAYKSQITNIYYTSNRVRRHLFMYIPSKIQISNVRLLGIPASSSFPRLSCPRSASSLFLSCSCSCRFYYVCICFVAGYHFFHPFILPHMKWIFNEL